MSKRIHVLLTIPNFDTAGSGKVVYDLADGIDKDRFEVSIMCRTNKGAFFSEVEKLGIPIYIMDFSTKLRPYWGLMKRTKAYRSFLKDKSIDIVHSWNWSSDWTEVLACRLSGVKFVYTKKSMSWGNKHWKIRSFLSHHIITLNTDMRAFFPWKKNQSLVPLGIDTSFYDPGHFTPVSEPETFRLITVANLVPVKSIETIIKAMALLADLPLELEIVGDAKTAYATELKSLAKVHQLLEKVKFTGKLPDVRPSLIRSDLYIISSKTEGMPMALVEAMSMGIPVLGADSPGINYVLEAFPELLFPFDDAEALAALIRDMVDKGEEQRRSLGEKLRQYCLDHFTMVDFIKSHENLYAKLLNH